MSNTITEARDVSPAPLHVAGDGVSLTVWDNYGEQPPLVFCHCAGTCGRIWSPVISRMNLPNRILAWDMRGHGDSDKPRDPDGYDTSAFARDLLAATDALELPDGIWAVGHSGGAAAIVCAELLRPGRFARTVLFDAIIAPPVFFATARAMGELSRRRKHVFDSRDAAQARLGGKAPMDRWSKEALNAYITHALADRSDGAVELKCPGEIEAWVYETGPKINLFDRLREVRTEALVVTGTMSYMLDYAHEQHERLSKSVLKILPDTGHFIPQERPGECAVLIDQWFSV